MEESEYRCLWKKDTWKKRNEYICNMPDRKDIESVTQKKKK